MRILLIEDDIMLGENICHYLIQCTYKVEWEKDGITAWTSLRHKKFDMILLDLGMPRLSGDDILKKMRSLGIDTPTLIITVRDKISDHVNSLDIGGDGFILKPFDIEVLHAHIRCIQRRTASSRADPTITIGDLSLNPATRLVFKSGNKIKLMRREFDLLQLLMESNGRVLSRKQLTQKLYGLDNDNIYSNAIEVHIYNLRKKCSTKIIKTYRHFGYGIHSRF